MNRLFWLRMFCATAIVMGLCLTVGTAAVPADKKLATAYRQLRFEQLYPPEAVELIQSRCQDAPRAVVPLTELTRDPKPEVRILVAALLGELGDADGAALLWQLLRDPVAAVRITASGALLRLRQFAVVAADYEGLRDERSEVRQLVVITLRDVAGKTAETALIKVLEDSNERVRMEAAGALATCGSRQAVPSLVERLRDSSVLVRTVVVGSLSALAGREHVEALNQALQDPDWHVRAMAAKALGHYCSDPVEGSAVADTLVGRLQTDDFALVRDRSAQGVACGQSDKTITALVQAILSDSCDVRTYAVQTICAARMAGALPLLMQHLHHPSVEVREKLMEIFGAIGGREQVPAVVEATSDPDVNVRLAAVAALRQLGARGAGDVVYAKLKDPNPHIRAAAARTCADIGDRTASVKLLPLLQDESGYVRAAAAETLGRLGDQSAVQPLIQLLSGGRVAGESTGGRGLVNGLTNDFLSTVSDLYGTQQRIRIVEALGVLKAPEAVHAVIEHGLKSEDVNLRAVSAYTLGQTADPRAVVPLQDTVRSFYAATGGRSDGGLMIDTGVATVPDVTRVQLESEARVRAAVAWALGRIAEPSSLETLRKALNDPNSLVRDAAAESISRIEEKQRKFADSLPKH